MLQVDRHTTLEEFARWEPLITDDNRERIKDAAVTDMFGDGGFLNMRIGDLTTVIAGDPRPLYQSGGRTVYDARRVEAFSDFIDRLIKTLQGYVLPPTGDSAKLSAGLIPSTFVESVYLFTRRYFGLPSFEDADRIRVSEFLLARRDDYNDKLEDRNMSNLFKSKK